MDSGYGIQVCSGGRCLPFNPGGSYILCCEQVLFPDAILPPFNRTCVEKMTMEVVMAYMIDPKRYNVILMGGQVSNVCTSGERIDGRQLEA